MHAFAMAAPCRGALPKRPMPAFRNFPWGDASLTTVCTLTSPVGQYQSINCTGFVDYSPAVGSPATFCACCRGFVYVSTFTNAVTRAMRLTTAPALQVSNRQYLTWQQLADLRSEHAGQVRALRLAGV